ncbi:hypothetical protein E2986_11601 [Frieseomelitta varia]|uniref:Uncharacterized protein n=1 Tax=Frieseomelitta varia TaxID=561572 RepID=A0A833SLI2_9HYME|nr:hypothetical protein E2986_11601 [Frieseomelitta varia]
MECRVESLIKDPKMRLNLEYHQEDLLEHHQEHHPEHPAENPVLVRNLVLDQNLVQRHHQSLDLLLGHVLNPVLLLDLVANQDQDLVPLSPEILQNQGPDQSQLQDLVLDPQPNLDLDLQPNLDLGLQPNLDLDLQLNLDLNPHQVRNLDRSLDPPSHDQDQSAAVVVNLVLVVVKVVLKVNE